MSGKSEEAKSMPSPEIIQRFRWTTLHRALDVLVLHCTNAEMKSVIEEIGCGPDLDRTPSPDQAKPKLKNLLSKACRQVPPRLDPEGDLLLNRVVREASAKLPEQQSPRAWMSAPSPPHVIDAAFLRSLALDGWIVRDGVLAPTSPVEIEQIRSGLRTSLEARRGTEAISRLDQLERGLDEGHWESANSDARGFLASVFDVIATERLDSAERDGAARAALKTAGFFRPDPRDPGKSLESSFVASLFGMLGSEGAHTGTTDEKTAIYRYFLSVLTAEYFLDRSSGPSVR